MYLLVKNYFIGLFFIFFLANCAFAPLSEPITSKTLGKGNQSHSITAGYPYAGYVYTTGVTETFDMGLQIESQALGLDVGARLILQATEYYEDQWSASLLMGAGLTTEGSYIYGGMIWSKKYGFYELAFIPRFNYLNISDELDADIVTDAYDKYSITISNAGAYYYMSLGIANTFWLRQGFGISIVLNGAYVFPWGASQDSAPIAPYGGLGLTFK